MRKFATAALIVASASAFLPATATAGGDPCYPGPCDGGYTEKYIVKYDTIVSFEPRPRAETSILLREGGYVEADCKGIPESDYGWCEIHSPVFRAFVPRHCLKAKHGHHWGGGPRRHHRYEKGYYHNGNGNGYEPEKYGRYGPDKYNGGY